jgi:CHAT domain-containing protein
MAGKHIFLRFLLVAAQTCVLLYSETIRVPQDYRTIKGAVCACADGDIVEVNDGFYFETNIILDKNITLKAKNLFGAIITGSSAEGSSRAIFLVRAKADISGFVLKNCANGILQRESPDVSWQAHDLAILNMKEAAVSVNDREGNTGRAIVYNVMVDNCRSGFQTNDAYGMDVRNCLVTDCYCAFSGFDHIYFHVDKAMVWNCFRVFDEAETPLITPATSTITRGQEIVVLDSLLSSGQKNAPADSFLLHLFEELRTEEEKEPKAPSIRNGLALAIAGDVYCRLRDCSRANEFYRAALRVGYESGSQEVLWRAQSGLALTSERQGKLSEALESYKKAILVLESIRGKLQLRYYNPGFFKDKMEIYVSVIRLLYQMHQKDPSQKYAEDAFAFAERARARGFLDSLEEAGLLSELFGSPGLRDRESRLSQGISALQIQLQSRNWSAEERTTLLERLERAENSYKDLLIRIKDENPRVADRPYPEPLGCAEIQNRLLTKDSALIEYVLGQDSSYAFLVTREAISLVQLPRSEEILSLVNGYLRFLSFRERKKFLAERGGQKLTNLLFGTFPRQLRAGIKKIIIVPDGFLYYLPFEALMEQEAPVRQETTQKEQARRFLIEKYEFSYAPSASALVRLLERRKSDQRAMDFLAVAVPKPPEPINLVSGLAPGFPALKYARREISTISRFFEGNKKEIIAGPEAEEGRLKQISLVDFGIIHFAAHGFFDDKNWDRSGLVLWRNKNSTEDGLFQPRDIYLLDLSSDLVVLSACQTGKGRLETGEGLIGLASAFLIAGSDSVLVSLWNINDRSTAQFMEYFYSFLTEGKSITRALKEAKVAMIHSRNNHPFYWAAFVLLGDSPGSRDHSISK